jgi:hypothetical protein
MCPTDVKMKDLEFQFRHFDTLKMFGFFRNFKPVYNYQFEDAYFFEYGRGLQIPADVFGCIIFSDYALRVATQAKEQLEAMLRGYRESILEDKNARQEYKETHEYLTKMELLVFEASELLRDAENLLPQRPLKDIYDQIRQNPAWYLQKELINNCVASGGCCGRSCGCCRKRCLTSKGRGVGHCTVLCGCC